MAEYSVVGQRLPRVDGWGKVLAQAQYVADIVLPNMLTGKLLLSPHPHARILHIDTSRARALPGVKGVISGDDILKVKFGTSPFHLDQYALAVGKVRHVGEAVGAVAAVDEETALEALELIRVEYEPLPAVFDPLEAMQPSAPRVHDEVEDNVSARFRRGYGDVDGAMRLADHVREDTLRTNPVNHAAMEPHGAVALWHAEGSLTMWTSSSMPFLLRRTLASLMGIPEARGRLRSITLGGSF